MLHSSSGTLYQNSENGLGIYDLEDPPEVIESYPSGSRKRDLFPETLFFISSFGLPNIHHSL
jgi:hypothetical protein